jgi:hypothetical protein
MAEIMQAAAIVIGLAGSAAAAAALCVLAVLCWTLAVRSSSPAPGKEPKPELVETDVSRRSLPEPTDAQLGFDFEAFQASMERECDLVLSRLCDDAVDGQVLRSLAEDLASQDPMYTEPPSFHDGGSALHFEAFQASEGDFEMFQVDIQQHCNLALEGMLDRAMDGQGDMVLKMLQDECADPSALADETRKGVLDLTGTQGTLSRQVEDHSTEQSRSLRTNGAFDKAFKEYHEQLLYEPEVVEQPVRLKSLHEMIIQHIHRTYSSYLLLAI